MEYLVELYVLRNRDFNDQIDMMLSCLKIVDYFLWNHMSKVNQHLIQTVFTKEQPNHNFTQQYMRVTVNDLFSLLGTTHNTLLIYLSQGKYKGLEKVLEGQKNWWSCFPNQEDLGVWKIWRIYLQCQYHPALKRKLKIEKLKGNYWTIILKFQNIKGISNYCLFPKKWRIFWRKKFWKKINLHGIEFLKVRNCENIQISSDKLFCM